MDADLLGDWEVDRDHDETVARFGRARMRVEGGRLTYQFEDGAASILTILSFSDGVLVTDQPSSPRVEETRYRVDAEGRLVFSFGQSTAHFRRLSS